MILPNRAIHNPWRKDLDFIFLLLLFSPAACSKPKTSNIKCCFFPQLSWVLETQLSNLGIMLCGEKKGIKPGDRICWWRRCSRQTECGRCIPTYPFGSMMGRPPSSPMGREKMKNPLMLLLLINSLHHKCPFPETSVQLPSSSSTPPPPGCCSLRQQKEKIREILPTSTSSNQNAKTLWRNFVVRAEKRQKQARVASYAVAAAAEDHLSPCQPSQNSSSIPLLIHIRSHQFIHPSVLNHSKSVVVDKRF